ncbi:MAG: hypothetical protein LBQ15_13610 [Clostridium sp.]|jgi:hypothetical protein|nr:hypothetical protein [Clostridium sp.]
MDVIRGSTACTPMGTGYDGSRIHAPDKHFERLEPGGQPASGRFVPFGEPEDGRAAEPPHTTQNAVWSGGV